MWKVSSCQLGCQYEKQLVVQAITPVVDTDSDRGLKLSREKGGRLPKKDG
jgi:hypothetical protein